MQKEVYMDSSYNPRRKSTDSWTDAEIDREGEMLIEYMQLPENMWIKGFAHSRGYPGYYFKNWCETKRGHFPDYYAMAMEMQERKLVEMPFFRKADGQQARFILTCQHGSEWVPEHKVKMAQDIKFEGVSYGEKFDSFDVNSLKGEHEYKGQDDKDPEITV
jgi:hypothetical protein